MGLVRQLQPHALPTHSYTGSLKRLEALLWRATSLVSLSSRFGELGSAVAVRAPSHVGVSVFRIPLVLPCLPSSEDDEVDTVLRIVLAVWRLFKKANIGFADSALGLVSTLRASFPTPNIKMNVTVVERLRIASREASDKVASFQCAVRVTKAP